MKPSSVLRFGAAALLVLCAASGCGDDDDEGTHETSLASTCGQICDNVVAQCGVSEAVHAECLNGCQALQLADVGCADELAAYLVCLGGATSVECGNNGQYVLLSPPSCSAQQQTYAACHAGGPPLAVCFAQPASSTICANSGAPNAYLCAGAPAGCVTPSGAAIGLGVYCCP